MQEMAPTSPQAQSHPNPKRKKCHLSQKCQRTQIDLTQEILEAGRKEFGVLECTQAHRNQGSKINFFPNQSSVLTFYFFSSQNWMTTIFGLTTQFHPGSSEPPPPLTPSNELPAPLGKLHYTSSTSMLNSANSIIQTH